MPQDFAACVRYGFVMVIAGAADVAEQRSRYVAVVGNAIDVAAQVGAQNGRPARRSGQCALITDTARRAAGREVGDECRHRSRQVNGTMAPALLLVRRHQWLRRRP